MARSLPLPPKCFAHALDVTLTSLHTAMRHIARRALEGCGSCKQEPTNESDVVAVVIELIVIIVDSLQRL